MNESKESEREDEGKNISSKLLNRMSNLERNEDNISRTQPVRGTTLFMNRSASSIRNTINSSKDRSTPPHLGQIESIFIRNLHVPPPTREYELSSQPSSSKVDYGTSEQQSRVDPSESDHTTTTEHSRSASIYSNSSLGSSLESDQEPLQNQSTSRNSSTAKLNSFAIEQSCQYISERKQKIIKRNRKKLIRKNVLDSYLTLTQPELMGDNDFNDEDQQMRIIFKTEIERSNNNPNFLIDLNSFLESGKKTNLISKRYQGFIKQSHLLHIRVWIKNSYPIYKNRKGKRKSIIHFDSEEHFTPGLDCLVDLRRLVSLGKADPETVLFPPSIEMADQLNQLYIKLDDEIYLFQPPEEEPIGLKMALPISEEERVLETSKDVRRSRSQDPNQYKSFSLAKTIELVERQIELDQTLAEVVDLELSHEESWNTEVGRQSCGFHLSRKLSEIDEKINVLNSQQTLASLRLDDLTNRFQQRQAAIEKVRSNNQEGKLLIRRLREERITRLKKKMENEIKPKHEKIKMGIKTRISELVKQIEVIYPIESIENISLEFSIGGIRLPNLNSHNFFKFNKLINNYYNNNNNNGLIYSFLKQSNQDDDVNISTGLGFIAHLTKLLSLYLSIPILYPISFIGSRSLVSDHISLIKGPKSFPLYSKGVDRYRFEYGVFLLNKDIEQIMYHRKLTVIDIRDILPNLKNLLLTLESAPVQINEINGIERLTEPEDQTTESEIQEEGTNLDRNFNRSRTYTNSSRNSNHSEKTIKIGDNHHLKNRTQS